MALLPPRKIEILLLEGTPFGLRYVDLRGKTARAFAAPRPSFKKLLEREEMKKAGVYILYGEPPEKPLPLVYIGEADILADRLPTHESRDFWTNVIVFTAQDETLDKGSVRYMESILVEYVMRDKFVLMENDVTPRIKVLSEANIAVMTDFIGDSLLQLFVLGYRILRYGNIEENQSAAQLFISKDEIQAQGNNNAEGFTVKAKSTAKKHLLSSASPSVIKTQNALLANGVLSDAETRYVFLQDYLFPSSSLAASLILGRSSNGLIEWKTRDGKTLKQLLASQVK